jgi:hypothetical protein
MEIHKRSFLVYFIALGIVLALFGLTYANYRFSLSQSEGKHFVPRWLGARYWVKNGVSPYGEQVGLAAQKEIYGRSAVSSGKEDLHLFAYPFFSIFVFVPFALFDMVWAKAIWMTCLEVCLVLLALSSIKLVKWQVSTFATISLIAFSVFWYYSVRALVDGQIAIVVSLLVVIALSMIRRDQDVLAGIFLSFTLIKPTIGVLLLPFILIWAISVRRFDLFWSVIITSFVMFLGSLALLPSWPAEWIRQLVQFPSYTSYIGSPITVITDAMPGIRTSLSVILYATFGIYLLIEWFLTLGKDDNRFLWTSMLTIIITNIVGFHSGAINFVLFIPVIFFILSSLKQKLKSRGSILVWGILIVLFAGTWGLYFISSNPMQEKAFLYLPIPFFLLLGLWWIRWWYIRGAKLITG